MPSATLWQQHSRALLFATAAAPPLTGWAVHVSVLRRRVRAAQRDPLTGLWRRESYTARAHRLLTRPAPSRRRDIAALFVDADHFKQINDREGHEAGDAVLAALGKRLTGWAGPRGVCGRLGGDEFAAVLPLPAEHRAERLEQLVRALHAPVLLDDGRLIQVSASVGVATTDILGTRDLTVLQRASDAALYDGKHTGRAVLATTAHTRVPSVNGRRLGRPGTNVWGQAA
ncbi:GGDEF domain-containing protein [Streptomyces sp. NRRL F-5630]|uniref:GGDEF domain-containing protein n=1 Tax=Streptomyces sp. NRRL F-5630 TaxID=1463864 RepID=UPI0004C52478|nr:GGDEF domain-containing protein [Streptomyces sp. NRRL F-5630]